MTQTRHATAGAGSSRHVPALDGLRGVAIGLVLVFHFTILRESGCPVDRAWIFLARIGWCGVDLFFVLSGFLITGILLDSAGRPGFLRSFYARRVLRIFPLYYAVVAFSFLVLPRIDHPRIASIGDVGDDALYYWLYLSNYALAAAGSFRHGILDISWSLAIEEQFYLIWPFLVLLLRRRGLGVLCGVLLLGAPILRLVLTLAGTSPIALYVLTPTRIDALAVGAALAVLSRKPGGLASLRGRAPIALAASAVGLLAVIVLDGTDQFAPIMQVAGYSLLAVGFGALLVLALPAAGSAGVRRVLENPLLRSLGRYSYALYLLHLPLRSALRAAIGGAEGLPPVFGSRLPALLLFGIVCLLLSFGLAWTSWHLLEKHFLALKKFFPVPRG